MTVDWEKSNTRIIIVCLLKEIKEIKIVNISKKKKKEIKENILAMVSPECDLNLKKILFWLEGFLSQQVEIGLDMTRKLRRKWLI